ncbi:TrmH family RNA methyltransferase ['Camptotheca acuminata' phytoplasma]|uniref:TrmH family RNA methyltransferase n=1 Tax='Camptotheca acuminata' phytoplasma TaxID=3239192 RepID=UPI003519E684
MFFSKNNFHFKKLKKLSLKKYRDFYQEFLIFGEHLIEEALKKGVVLELYTISSDKEGTLISPNLMKELNSNKIIYNRCALCKKVSEPLKSDKILVLDDVQDPSNMGALLRSACAFGFKHVFSSLKSADFYNEKTIQSSQGALFSLFLKRGNIEEFLTTAKKNDYLIFSALSHEKNIELNEASALAKQRKKILVLGNEGTGISPLVQNKSDYFLCIQTDLVESLNVNAAGSILMYILN